MGCSQWFFFDVVGMLRSLVRVCSELWIPGNKWDGTPGKPGTIGNDHPSYQQRGHQAHELLTTDLL